MADNLQTRPTDLCYTMDAYTARCLQVSTSVSDNIPLQRRRSEMMKRQNSSFDARTAATMRPTHARSKTSIGGMYPVQTDMSSMHQQYSNTSTPMSSQQYHFNSPPSAMSAYGTPYQMPYMTPVTPYTPNEWNLPATIDSKQLQGLGMDFPGSEYAMNSTEPTDDIIHLNNGEAWRAAAPDSPERRSSTSDSEITELTASTTAHSRQNSAALDADRDMRRSRSLHRHSRSLSRTPASRAASKRSHRRQLSCQAVPHGRNPSACGFMPPLPQTPALLDSQAEALSLSFDQVNFMNSGFSDADMQLDGDFQNNFDSLVDLSMGMGPSMSANGTRLMTSPSDGMFWDSSLDAEVYAQSAQNGSEHHHQNGCCSSDDPEKPDLFESLREEASSPPEEDMHPEDPDMVPQEQEPRFEGDLYTPRWVRGQGNKREGYCGLCKPGRWLVLKNSAYWYDKSFTHGISAATGQPFEGPRQTRRMAGNPDVWEGLCGGCNDWIALISSKKKGTTWFRHAYKCHGKNKDGAKKGRQNTPPSQQTMPYANMKPVTLSEMPQQQVFHHQQHELFNMPNMPAYAGSHGLDMRDPTPFSDIIYH